MSPTAIRSLRIQELTKMALRGATLADIQIRAYGMASPPTAKGYVEEVLRRMQK